ncbi:DUF5994 family protein [Nonomuraea longispora]|uniref:DUF5994 family protein n=1 Tax=Nonomuraea longispora TaxID=1848320 RepID=UPI0024830CF2|nr:DUF5994 family protein [Nonomuraea longispora]
MTPTLLSQHTPLSPVAWAIPRVDFALRLALYPAPDRRAVVDGAWWPCSRNAAAELPPLIAAVDQRLGRTILRIGVYRDAWQHIPRRIPARGRQVRVGWFRHSDPRVITLVFATGEPIALLLIPPDTAAGTAEAALKLTAQDTTGLATDDILILASLPPDPAIHATSRAGTTDSPARWENEGGSVIAQKASTSDTPASAPA